MSNSLLVWKAAAIFLDREPICDPFATGGPLTALPSPLDGFPLGLFRCFLGAESGTDSSSVTAVALENSIPQEWHPQMYECERKEFLEHFRFFYLFFSNGKKKGKHLFSLFHTKLKTSLVPVTVFWLLYKTYFSTLFLNKLLWILPCYLNELFLRLLDLGVHNINYITEMLFLSLINTKFLSVEIGSIANEHVKANIPPCSTTLWCGTKSLKSEITNF